MIVNLILNVLVGILNTLFSVFPTVTTLPSIAGADLDGSLVAGVSFLRRLMVVFFPIQIIFEGFLFLMGYYFAKAVLKIFLGSRTPGN